jgi:hypothetical protein
MLFADISRPVNSDVGSLLNSMNVEYFADGSQDCPLILLYGANPTDALTLSKALRMLSNSFEMRVAIHELPSFVSVEGCQLFASVAGSDIGVKVMVPAAVFDCSLRAETWDNIIGLLEPFCHRQESLSGTSFQYLDATGDIRLLISTERAW